MECDFLTLNMATEGGGGFEANKHQYLFIAMRVTRTIAVGPSPVSYGSVQSDTVHYGRTWSCAARDGQVWSDTVHNVNLYMGRIIIRQHFLALNVTFLPGLKWLLLLEYCIQVQKENVPLNLVVCAKSGCLQTQQILPGNVCRKLLKFPENPGNLNW